MAPARFDLEVYMKFRLITVCIALFVVTGMGRITSAQDETKKTVP